MKADAGEMLLLVTECHLAFGTWSPGDGKTRYRFFLPQTPAPGFLPSRYADYDTGGAIFTALGRGEAITFLRGYLEGIKRERTRNRAT